MLGFLLHSKNSLTEPEATTLALSTPKPSEAIEDSDCVSIPSCPSLGTARAQDDCSGPYYYYYYYYASFGVYSLVAMTHEYAN